jgi:DNA-binding Xre family transcriptional regulator
LYSRAVKYQKIERINLTLSAVASCYGQYVLLFCANFYNSYYVDEFGIFTHIKPPIQRRKKHLKENLEKLIKLNKSMKVRKSNITTLDQFKDKHFGKPGTEMRDQLEEGYKNFKLGAMLYKARLEKGMTQEELAEKAGTTKSYISKIENDVKEVRISTLQKIVEVGLGGQVQLSIKL